MAKQLLLFDSQERYQNSTQKNEYLHYQNEIPTDLKNGSTIALTRETPLKIYSLGFQPAKSIPEISRWFLHKYISKNAQILEPFSGSGTTIIESIKYQTAIDWLDYHPLSQLICQVKTTKFDLLKTLKEGNIIINQSQKQTILPQTIFFKNKDFWFQKEVQEALEILRQNILETPLALQPIFWLIFSLTVRKSSDMNEGMILAAKRSHVKKIAKKTRNDVFNYFKHYLDKTIESLIEWQPFLEQYQSETYQIKSQLAQNIMTNKQYDAVITSPPYINAIDYIWASKFELHWLGMVKNDQERLNLYSQEIGTERINKQQVKELRKTGYSTLDQLIENIYFGKKYQASKGQNQLRANVTYQYFIDMKQHFMRCFEQLKTGGYYCFTIGDISTICGVEIPVASILTEIASEIGFEEIFKFYLLLKNRKLNIPRNVTWAKTIKHDTIVVMRKGQKKPGL
jgi:hypothetical protein